MRLRSIQLAVVGALAGLVLLVSACERAPTPFRERTPAGPVQAVEVLVEDLRRDDLAAYARHAVPKPLHERLETAWREGRTLWPLTELPLDAKFQAFLDALAAPGSEKKLLAAFGKQFSGAHAELRTAATTLGLFATQYVNNESNYSQVERDHYAQLIGALSRWGQRAPLADPVRARKAVPRMALAARATGLGWPGSMRRTGMDGSLRRLGPFFARMERVLVDYGVDFDAALADMKLSPVSQSGDEARVRMQYVLAGQPIDAVVLLERQDGRWYLSDLLRRAEAEANAGLSKP